MKQAGQIADAATTRHAVAEACVRLDNIFVADPKKQTVSQGGKH
jgi:hypothetical protein